MGPISVAAALGFAADAFLKAVVMKGTDVLSVANLGRNVSQKLRTALAERDRTCVVPGCGEERDLEVDHVVDSDLWGPTKLRNLAPLCRWHHYLKTFHGYVLRRTSDGWVFHPPTGPPGNDDGKLQPELVPAD